MPLTPDDVVTKQFQHVRFKEGFDPDEVDDFLDEIVVEWRKTIAENEELKARVAALEAGAPAADVPAPAPAPVAEEAPVAAPVAAPAGTPLPTVASAGLLELAQRLHDEHVAEGVAQRDKLISEAKSKAASIVADAETRNREETERLEATKAELENRIGELRQFERDYRSQLRGFIESRLKDLENTALEGASAGSN